MGIFKATFFFLVSLTGISQFSYKQKKKPEDTRAVFNRAGAKAAPRALRVHVPALFV